jgi:hypothetical protein
MRLVSGVTIIVSSTVAGMVGAVVASLPEIAVALLLAVAALASVAHAGAYVAGNPRLMSAVGGVRAPGRRSPARTGRSNVVEADRLSAAS